MDNTFASTKSGYIFFVFNSYIYFNFSVYILIIMSREFEQISLKPGFMKHNGGLLFKTISENEYQFKATPCVTISLELKFISTVKLGQELIGNTKIQKKTKSMVFLTCELVAENKIVATASGVWKILKKLPGAESNV